jgi:serralysin
MPTFTGGVTVAAGDVNGDGRADIVAGVASGGPPMVVVYDGRTSSMLSAFFAFPPTVADGVNVAVADVSGTGHAQIVATLASLPLPVVATYDVNGTMTSAFLAPGMTGGGLRVAAADINGDNATDLILSAGYGTNHVTILSGRTQAVLDDFYAFDPYATSGVFVG